MTQFRFRYKCLSYRRWRCRTSRRRPAQVLAPLAAASCAPSMAAWRRRLPKPVQLPAVHQALQVGRYLVGDEGDLLLCGHPAIRY